MLIEYTDQAAIVNIDQVSFIEKTTDGDQFFIDFYKVISSLKADDELGQFENPTRNNFAQWVFDDKASRDLAILQLIATSNGRVLNPKDN